jgi:hypothetical protein
MPGFATIGDFVSTVEDDGRLNLSFFHKVNGIQQVPQRWVDLSMLPGTPRQNIYPGGLLTATAKWYRSAGNIWHGSLQAPALKIISKLSMWSNAVSSCYGHYQLNDILMFYALIDMDTSDPQDFVNGITLPRYYANAKGVQMYLVVTDGLGTSDTRVSITYTNSLGVSGRVTPPFAVTASGVPNNLAYGVDGLIDHFAPFIPLQEGDVGVRSVERIQLTEPTGSGWACLVLCRPIARFYRDTHSSTYAFPTEQQLLGHAQPIHDEACLNFLGWFGYATGLGAAAIIQGCLEVAYR